MLFLFLLCVLGLWLYYSYLSVVKKREKLFDAFEHVDTALSKRYGLITDLIVLLQKNMKTEPSITENIERLRDEVINMGLKSEFLNRRIALDGELEKESNQIIAALTSNQQLSSDAAISDAMRNYTEISNDIDIAKQDYNAVAKELRRAVDVFPTSFVARLNNIRSYDYMK